tara:strand:+ start:1184 stop:1525 length:342 start_codon:yes stop_codon:yes gene_type:complete
VYRIDGIAGHDTIYRITVHDAPIQYQVQCIGTECVDRGGAGEYPSLEDMPKWMQSKLALLYMVEPLDIHGVTNWPSTVHRSREGFPRLDVDNSLQIKGVGSRQSVDTFWVIEE